MTGPILSLTASAKLSRRAERCTTSASSSIPEQVTALIGENGAGKSTLVKTLTGIYQPDAGEIRVGGEPVAPRPRTRPFGCGITAIHQETVLFDELSVAENIYLGHAPRTRFQHHRLDDDARRAREAARGHGRRPSMPKRACSRTWASPTSTSSPWPAPCRSTREVVIMDEPTASLSHKEIEELFVLVELLKQDGKAVLFISPQVRRDLSHRRPLHRVPRWRDGGQGRCIKDTSQNEIIKLMVGRSVDHIFPAAPPTIGEPVLEVEGLSHPTEFDNISFTLRRGEILGFYGLVGRRAQRGDAGAVRHRQHVARYDHAGRQIASRRNRPPTPSRRASSMCPRSAASRASSSACRSSRTSRCHRSRSTGTQRLPAAGGGVRARAANTPSGSTCAPPRSARMPAPCRAATSRRW